MTLFGRHEAPPHDRKGPFTRAEKSCSLTSPRLASMSSFGAGMWEMVRSLRATGVTIILTTHLY